MKVIREFERLQKKICRHKMSIMFNEICIYIYIYIYIYILYIYIYIYIYICMYRERVLTCLVKDYGTFAFIILFILLLSCLFSGVYWWKGCPGSASKCFLSLTLNLFRGTLLVVGAFLYKTKGNSFINSALTQKKNGKKARDKKQNKSKVRL